MQRERILRAVVDIVSIGGFGPMSVEDVVVTARLSRRTFYDHFRSKEDAFLAAYDEAIRWYRSASTSAFHEHRGDLAARATAALSELVAQLAADPAVAELCLVEAHAAGSTAAGRCQQTTGDLTEWISTVALEARGGEPLAPMTAEMILGGLREVLYARTLHGELGKLRDDVPDLACALLRPHVGAAAAGRGRSAARTLGSTSETTNRRHPQEQSAEATTSERSGVVALRHAGRRPADEHGGRGSHAGRSTPTS